RRGRLCGGRRRRRPQARSRRRTACRHPLLIKQHEEFSMNTPQFGYRTSFGQQSAALFDEGLRQHMLRVYNYMALGLVLTGVVAFTVASVPALYVPIFSTPLKWVVMLAPLAFVFLFSFRIHSMSASGAQAMFWAFCGVMGLSLSSVFLVFTGTS